MAQHNLQRAFQIQSALCRLYETRTFFCSFDFKNYGTEIQICIEFDKQELIKICANSRSGLIQKPLWAESPIQWKIFGFFFWSLDVFLAHSFLDHNHVFTGLSLNLNLLFNYFLAELKVKWCYLCVCQPLI